MKSVIISGGSHGIGAAAVELFSENGWRVLLGYEKAEREAGEIADKHKNVIPFQVDVTDESSVSRFISKGFYEFGTIDALVTSAGVSLDKLFTETDEGDWNRVMDINAGGTYRLCRAVSKEMIAAGGGSIVAVSSVWGICGASYEAAYSASKAAVIGLTKALAKELAPSNVRVNCVAPGVIDTRMNARLSEEEKKELCSRIPLGRYGTPREVAEAIWFLTNAEYITGHVLSVNGGFLI